MVVYVTHITYAFYSRTLFYVGGLHLTHHGNGLNISSGLVPTFVPRCSVSLFARKRADGQQERRIAFSNKKMNKVPIIALGASHVTAFPVLFCHDILRFKLDHIFSIEFLIHFCCPDFSSDYSFFLLYLLCIRNITFF